MAEKLSFQMGGLLGGGSSINFMMYTRAQGVILIREYRRMAAKDMIPLCTSWRLIIRRGKQLIRASMVNVSHEMAFIK